MPPKLTPQQVIELSKRGPLTTGNVQQLATAGYAGTNFAPQAPQQPVRRFGVEADAGQAAGQAGNVAGTADQSVNFGRALQDLLKNAQGMNNPASFINQEFNAQDQQNQRMAYTAPGLIGASPGMQSASRNAEAGALNPTIQGARQGAQTFQGQLNSFKEGVNSTLDLLKEESAQQDRERQEARDIVNEQLDRLGSSAFDIVDKSWFKKAGYSEEKLAEAKKGLLQKEAEEKALKKQVQTIDLGDKVGFYDLQGNLIRYETKGTSPSSTTDPNKPLSSDAAKVHAIATTIAPEINKLKEAFTNDYSGSLWGITSGTNRELVKLVDQVADKVGRLRSGGAVNKDEEARFKKQIASFSDIAFGDSSSAISALDGILTEANTVAESMKPGSSTQTQGSLEVSAPNGKTYRFSTPEQANAFKKAIGK